MDFGVTTITPAPGNGSLSGGLVDNGGNPISGATVQIEGGPSATSDAGGNFTVNGITPGGHRLVINGSAANDPGNGVFYPDGLQLHRAVYPGIDNGFSGTITLPSLDGGTQQSAGGLAEVDFGLDALPGSNLTVPANGVVGGSEDFTYSTVKSDRLPLPVPFGLEPALVVTFHPRDEIFNWPVSVTQPNVTGLLPGTVIDMFAYDISRGDFVNVGAASADDEGNLVRVITGLGPIRSGQHFLAGYPGEEPDRSGGSGGVLPVSLGLAAATTDLTNGANVQLQVTGVLADGGTVDLAAGATGTVYTSTNANLLTVSANGLVTATVSQSGNFTAGILATNQGSIAGIQFQVTGPTNDAEPDGMDDGWEMLYGLDTTINDSTGNLDGDTLDNITEFQMGTLPNMADTDGDGALDHEDLDPLHPEESPPTVTITQPDPAVSLLEGTMVTVGAEVEDDGGHHPSPVLRRWFADRYNHHRPL